LAKIPASLNIVDNNKLQITPTSPLLPNTNYKIVISGNVLDENDNLLKNEFVSKFKTQDVKITVLRPNTNLVFCVGDSEDILWSSSFLGDTTVELEYSIDNGSSWLPVIGGETIDSSLGTFSWTVPSADSEICLVKITSNSYTQLFDISNDNFLIKTRQINILQPNGGEITYPGDKYEITWLAYGLDVDTLKLEYSTNGGTGWNDIIKSPIANINFSTTGYADNVFDYSLSTGIGLGWNGKVGQLFNSLTRFQRCRVFYNQPYSVGGAYFYIQASTNTTDGVDGNWVRVSNNEEIPFQDWKWFDLINIGDYIAYRLVNVVADTNQELKELIFTDMVGGVSANDINVSDESYDWYVPYEMSVNCLVRVTSNERPTYTDDSDSTFTIQLIPPTPSDKAILTEDGFNILTEDGFKILLEDA